MGTFRENAYDLVPEGLQVAYTPLVVHAPYVDELGRLDLDKMSQIF